MSNLWKLKPKLEKLKQILKKNLLKNRLGKKLINNWIAYHTPFDVYRDTDGVWRYKKAFKRGETIRFPPEYFTSIMPNVSKVFTPIQAGAKIIYANPDLVNYLTNEELYRVMDKEIEQDREEFLKTKYGYKSIK